MSLRVEQPIHEMLNKQYWKGRYILPEGTVIGDWDNDMVFEYDPKEGTAVTEFLC